MNVKMSEWKTERTVFRAYEWEEIDGLVKAEAPSPFSSLNADKHLPPRSRRCQRRMRALDSLAFLKKSFAIKNLEILGKM